MIIIFFKKTPIFSLAKKNCTAAPTTFFYSKIAFSFYGKNETNITHSLHACIHTHTHIHKQKTPCSQVLHRIVFCMKLYVTCASSFTMAAPSLNLDFHIILIFFIIFLQINLSSLRNSSFLASRHGLISTFWIATIIFLINHIQKMLLTHMSVWFIQYWFSFVITTKKRVSFTLLCSQTQLNT